MSEFDAKKTSDSGIDLLNASFKYHPILGYLFEGNIPLERQMEFVQQLRSCGYNSDDLQSQLQTEHQPETAPSSVSEFLNSSTSLQTTQNRFTYLNNSSHSNAELSLSTEREQKKHRVPQVIDQQGWKWRKHGQKTRKSGCIRSYYRCSMRSSGCLASLIVNMIIIPGSAKAGNHNTIWDAKGSHNHEPPAAPKLQVCGVAALAEPSPMASVESEVHGGKEYNVSEKSRVEQLGDNDRGNSFSFYGDDGGSLFNEDIR